MSFFKNGGTSGALARAHEKIREMGEVNARLRRRVEELEKRPDIDPALASFAQDLSRRTQLETRFPSPQEALKVFEKAAEDYASRGNLRPGESVEDWRRRQLHG